MSERCDRCGGSIVPGSALCRSCLDAEAASKTAKIEVEITVVCAGCHRSLRETIVVNGRSYDTSELLAEVARRAEWTIVHAQDRGADDVARARFYCQNRGCLLAAGCHVPIEEKSS